MRNYILLQTGYAQCAAIEEGYLEISSADGQTMDRYCGTHLSQSSDATNPANSAGVVYGKILHTYNKIIPGYYSTIDKPV